MLSEHRQLDSLFGWLVVRAFALTFVIVGVKRFVINATAERVVVADLFWDASFVIAAMLLSAALCFISRAIAASRAGLWVGRGKRARLIPWQEVEAMRSLNWMRYRPGSPFEAFYIELTQRRSITFLGLRNAREIVAAFWADSRNHPATSGPHN